MASGTPDALKLPESLSVQHIPDLA